MLWKLQRKTTATTNHRSTGLKLMDEDAPKKKRRKGDSYATTVSWTTKAWTLIGELHHFCFRGDRKSVV